MEARYDYRDEYGKLLKRVERLPGKRFRQCVPSQGDWLYEVQSLTPMLYNAHLLRYADVVCICEGEKDCDSINSLKLIMGCSQVIAVTSGSARSWDPKLAKQLVGKRVIIAPDDDEAGTRYADAVEASLVAEGIERKRISFAGTGCKDASDYMERHGREQFEEFIEADWVSLEGGPWFIQEPTLNMVMEPDLMRAEITV